MFQTTFDRNMVMPDTTDNEDSEGSDMADVVPNAPNDSQATDSGQYPHMMFSTPSDMLVT